MVTKNRLRLLFVVIMAGLLAAYAQQEPFSFILLADPQFGMCTADKDFSQETANFEFAVAAVNRLKPGFVVILGDIVNKAGDPAQIGEYQRISRKIDPSIPVYRVAGNHDLGNDPTPESLSAYRKTFGPDYYGFRAGPVYGIVLNSTLIHSPKNALRAYEEQDSWLGKELQNARRSGAKHIIVFQHHPLFLNNAQEPDQYENIPGARRQALLERFRNFGIAYVFAGHTHKNVIAQDGGIAVVATGPVGKPLGKDGSGIRVAIVGDSEIEHRYYEFGMMPEKLGVNGK